MNQQVLDFIRAAELSGRIVDAGSLDVNGSVASVVKVECGIDMRPGKGVDRVMFIEDMADHFSDLDAVTCCETMEHVENWRAALGAIWKTIKIGGALVFSVPTKEKGYHGYPADYWRWEPGELKQIFSDQDVQRMDMAGCSWAMHIVKKTEQLDFTVEPSRIVDTRNKKAKKEQKGKNERAVQSEPAATKPDNGKRGQEYKDRIRAAHAGYQGKHG